MQNFAPWLAAGLLLLFLAGCVEKDPISQDDRVGYSYFPLTVGDYRIFEVRTITTTPIEDSLHNSFMLREEIVDSFQNAESDTTYILHRSVRDMATDPWKFDSAWTIRRTPMQAIKVENNIPLVKLSFPLSHGLEWNANALNDRSEDVYIADALGAVFEAQNETFDNTIKVLQAEGEDIVIFFDLRQEVFARNVGLVYKETSQIIYCNDSETGCLGMGIIENSFSEKLEIIEYEVQ